MQSMINVFLIIWTILIIIAVLSIPVLSYYILFKHNKKKRVVIREKWLKDIATSDINMDYKEGFIDAIEKIRKFDV